jgi:hypothetical protein
MDIKRKYIAILDILRNFYGKKEKATNELDEIMKIFIKNKYIGTIPYDYYPLDKIGCSYAIVNTDHSNKSGQHWVAVYRNKDKIYVYDSFARHLDRLMPEFCNRMIDNGFKIIQVNKKLDQANDQEDCGLRSAVWLMCVDQDGIKKASLI